MFFGFVSDGELAATFSRREDAERWADDQGAATRGEARVVVHGTDDVLAYYAEQVKLLAERDRARSGAYTKPMTREADVIVGGVVLDHGQSATLRVAITSMHSRLSSPAERRQLGPIGESYKQRLDELLKIIFDAIERQEIRSGALQP